MKNVCLSLLVCSVVIGCGKSEPQPVPTVPVPAKPAAAATIEATTGAPEAPAPDAVPDSIAPAAVDAAPIGEVKEDPGILTKAQALDLVVNDYITQFGKPPANLEELVARRLIPRLPEAPAGKKFVLDKDNHVTVANQ